MGAQDQRARDYMAENYAQIEPSEFQQEQLQKERNEAMLKLFPQPTVDEVRAAYIAAGYGDDLPLMTAEDYKEQMKFADDYQKQSYFAKNFRSEKAGGGIAKIAGIDQGPQTTSMNPDSGGLKNKWVHKIKELEIIWQKIMHK